MHTHTHIFFFSVFFFFLHLKEKHQTKNILFDLKLSRISTRKYEMRKKYYSFYVSHLSLFLSFNFNHFNQFLLMKIQKKWWQNKNQLSFPFEIWKRQRNIVTIYKKQKKIWKKTRKIFRFNPHRIFTFIFLFNILVDKQTTNVNDHKRWPLFAFGLNFTEKKKNRKKNENGKNINANDSKKNWKLG